MKYDEFRIIAKTGGLLGAHGHGIIGTIIRVATGESLQHVAILFWEGDGLFVAEFIEGTGFQIMAASQWVKKRKKYIIYYGYPPEEVLNNQELVKKLIYSIRDDDNAFKRNYNYWELPIVWFANIFGHSVSSLGGVCSSFVGRIYDKCGVKKHMQVPGDMFEICDSFGKITYDDN